MRTQTVKIELPPLYRKQHAALYSPARYSVTEGSTKCGKTMGCIVWQMHQCFERVGEHWWIAPTHKQAQIAYDRAKEYLPEALRTVNDSRKVITLHNGSRWSFLSGEKPDNLYGEDVLSAVIDEASRIREESWHAIRSTLTATRGPVRMIGNVKGRGNWFYRLARRAQSGEKGYSYHKITALDAVDAGIFPREELEDARRALPEQVFRELYLAEPADDGGNPFGIDAIAACLAPLSTGEPVVWGWDLAKSHDWTVGVGLDADGAVCRFERFQAPWGVTKERIREMTSVHAIMDSTGVGDPIVEDLQRQGLSVEGFRFTSTSKQRLMEGLATAIQESRIRYPDGVLRHELDVFEYEYTRTGVRYAAPSGLHDDCVCALALAVHGYETTYRRRLPEIPLVMGKGRHARRRR